MGKGVYVSSANDEQPHSYSRHIVFPTNIQTHALQQLSVADDPQAQFELSLKVAAVLTRGVVISDSDLNNNEMLHGLVHPGRTFRVALEAGFVRRAVREVDGGPAAQAQIAEELRRNSPERAAKIPAGHVEALDQALAVAEQRVTTPPLLWTFSRLGEIFANRLAKNLQDEIRVTRGQEPVHSMLVRVADWIAAERSAGRQIAAAALEKALTPKEADGPMAAAWRHVWSLVLTSYNGNIATALNLPLADPVDNPLRFLPSGPTSAADELSTELALYTLPVAEGVKRFHVDMRAVPLPDILKYLEFDLDRLAAIDIREIIAAREEAEPDDFFDVRHQSLGSGELLEELLTSFLERAAEYVERFDNVSRKLTAAATKAAIRKRFDSPSAHDGGMNAYYLKSDDKEFLVEQLMCVMSNSPFVPAQMAMCDLTVLRAYRPDFNELAQDLVGHPVLMVSRPDYRIIKTIGEELLKRG